MKLIERIYYSILGKPIKNLLLFLVITLLGSFLSASFSIYQANVGLERKVKEELSPIILVEWKEDLHSSEFSEFEKNKETIIEKIKSDNRITFIENRFLLNDELALFQPYDDNDKLLILNSEIFQFGCLGNQCVDERRKLNLIGIDNNKVADIKNQIADLNYGRIFSKDEIDNGSNSILIISDISQNDHLQSVLSKLGKFNLYVDELDIPNLDEYRFEHVSVDYSKDVNIAGVGKYNRQFFAENTFRSIYSKTTSGLFIPVKFMDELSKDLTDIYKKIADELPWYKEDKKSYYDNLGKKYLTETYIELDNIDDLKVLVDMIKDETDGYVNGLYTFVDSYSDVKMITERLNMIAIICLVVCSISSVILLSLIIQVFVNERKHEIGIFLSLGESKKNVITQIILEVLIVGLLGLSVSVFSGHLLSKSFSNDLLEKQIVQLDELYGDKDTTSYEIEKEELLNTYSVNITLEYILCVYAGGTLIIVLSSIYPTRSILKMKPKKILL